jgi:hypothetical protein
MPNPRSSERWLSIGIRTTMPWSTVEVSTEYQSFAFKMLPETDAFLPTLAVWSLGLKSLVQRKP